ncbi:GroES-like protein [Laetiporus sulphureus 93-53]|uniref:GroES-like protein n=1 Tax=Laetiporus sulphureus 93-53 TaxID=1314785 RepID=A0A165I7H2_9APHY|nr:GroES-like protein [Laetiporus sulphureus 93-53]KZT12690.1 GroES-like protein [Laetiporus sulphureus 93-53]
MGSLLTRGDGFFHLKDVEIPVPGDGEVLVKVVAVSQNPTDWKTLRLHPQPGNVIGCDFAGVVVMIGSHVPEGLRRVGERVAGVVHGGTSPNGAFAEYTVASAKLLISVPDTLSFEEAAQLGIPCYTACQSLYQCLGLPTPLSPTETPIDVLIWSGTSATGQYAIQLAKLAGLRVISTASPKNIDFVKGLGADEVFDYADSFTFRKIISATSGRLKYAIDCTSEGTTPYQVSMSLSEEGGTIATLLPYTSRRQGVKTEFILAYTILGKTVEIPFHIPAYPEHYRNAVKYSKLISTLLAKSVLKPCTIRVFPHGLESVHDGFEYMKAGKVHAEKLIYRIADTPGLSDEDD